MKDAETVLLSIRSREEWEAVKQRCGSLPAVFGRVREVGSTGRHRDVQIELLHDSSMHVP